MDNRDRTKVEQIDKSWTMWTKVGQCGLWTKWDNMDKSWTILRKVGKCGQNGIIWTKVGQYGQKLESVDKNG